MKGFATVSRSHAERRSNPDSHTKKLKDAFEKFGSMSSYLGQFAWIDYGHVQGSSGGVCREHANGLRG